MPEFDLLIIGSGVAGRTAADQAVAAGLRTGLIERREFGGTCPLRGCEPKKVLFAAAEAVERARDARGFGAPVVGPLEWPALEAFKRSMTDVEPARLESHYRDAGVTVIHGDARFVSEGEVAVGDELYSARHLLIATGARPAPLGIPGEELVTDSEQFMALERMPRRLVFIGGGYISFEFAAIANAAGAEVTIVHRGAVPLSGFDPDVVGVLVAQYASCGIDVRVNAPVASVRRSGDGLAVTLEDGSELACDLAVHGAGRVPALDDLDLAKAGVAAGRHGIEVDESMRSLTNPRVYAAGDAAACSLPLTPPGVAQARVAVRAMTGDSTARFDTTLVPSVVFSYPPLAAVGITDGQARKAGLGLDATFTDTSDWWSSKRIGLSHTAAKTVVESGTGRVVGATILGHGADEVVNLFTLAIDRAMTAEDLKRILWAYPTAGSEIVYLF